ncbi:MAG: multiprotein bridging factor aMBF1 [Methanocalculaceae archaeon]|jgi:putative transcription factor|nr:multiprotein bridging factor aMBF1 [Methanocalculaceae archaeon]
MQTEYCELCGAPLTKKGKLVQIEGAKPMKVCDKCAKLGTEVQAPRPASAGFGRPTIVRKGSTQVPSASAPRKRDMFDYMEGDIVEDFPKRIAAARQAKGFSQKDLAFVLKMQEGDIKKLERGEREPTEAERKKLETELGIELLDTGSDSDSLQQGGVAATTLGDVLQVKRK